MRSKYDILLDLLSGIDNEKEHYSLGKEPTAISRIIAKVDSSHKGCKHPLFQLLVERHLVHTVSFKGNEYILLTPLGISLMEHLETIKFIIGE